MNSIETSIRFAENCIEGKQPAGNLVIKACKRFISDLQSIEGYCLSESHCERVIKFFSYLRHSKGEWAGKTIELADWQVFNLVNIFGWINEETGLRRFKTAYTEVPRKNGKSTIAAGVGLYCQIGDNEEGAEVYAAATKRDQAKIVWTDAKRMVQASPSLSKHVDIYSNNISMKKNNSKFEPLGADENTLDGLNVHAAIIDELHAHKNRGVYDLLDTATGARRQPLMFSITTAGTDRLSICWELHQYSEKILDQILRDEEFYCFISSAEMDCDFLDPINWQIANPNYGISAKIEDLERKARRAKEILSYQNTFKRLHLNIWTEQTERWIDIEKWDNCKEALCLDHYNGRDCYIGIDMSSSIDLSSVCLLFETDGYFDCFPFFFVPEERIQERSKRDRVPYDLWSNEGLIVKSGSTTVDYDTIRKFVNDLGYRFNVREVAYDPWNAVQLATQLSGDGFNMVKHRQGYSSMSGPTKELEKNIISGTFRHDGNPVLRWMASNMAVQMDSAGNVKPAKDKSQERIDGVVALIMAIGLATTNESITNPYAGGRGVYVG